MLDRNIQFNVSSTLVCAGVFWWPLTCSPGAAGSSGPCYRAEKWLRKHQLIIVWHSVFID